MSNLFISHSSRDNAAAKELQTKLSDQGHHSVFLDLDPETGIQAGVSWERTLYTKLRACRAVVALCSDSYLASQWCFAEIALARMEGKELFVLQIDPWSEQTQMPSILTEEQFIDLRANKDDGYQRLWNGFKVKGIVAAEAREWKLDEPPYPGLRAFREEDAPIFFGRDEEVRTGGELLNRVRRQGHPRMVMVLGSSGSGKSSLVRAGIVPQLRRDRGQWLVVKPFRPGRQPARELAASLSQAFEEAGQASAWEEIHRWLEPAHAGDAAVAILEPAATAEAETSPAEARKRLLQALSAMEGELTAADDEIAGSVRRLKDYLNLQQTTTSSPPGAGPPPSVASPLDELASRLRFKSGFAEATVVLVIDQFEELLGHEEEHPATHFLAMLRAAMETGDSPLLVIGTMRSDYLGMLQRSRVLQGLGFKTLSVGPMSRDGMRQIIEEPAKLGQIQLENGLSDLLLEDTETSDALPLLAFTLRIMWDRYRDDRLLDIREYKQLGGLQGAVAQVAEETFQDTLAQVVDEASRDALAREIRDAFLSMARPAVEGTGWSRQSVCWEHLSKSVKTALLPFIDPQRLLVMRPDGTVEVAHEALFRSWDRLCGWLDENAEGLHLLREIRVEADRWAESETDEDKEPYLFRGGRLARALELRDGGVLPLKDVDKSFVDASLHAERARIEAEEARRKQQLRRARMLAASIGVALIAMIGSYLKLRHEAQLTLSRQLAAQSSELLDSRFDRALLLALAARNVADTEEARRSLLTAVQHNPRLWRFLFGAEHPIRNVDFSGNGKILVAVAGPAAGDVSADSAIWLWDAATGKTLENSPLQLPETPNPVAAVSADGRWLAAGGTGNGKINLWDLGAEPRQLITREAGRKVDDLAFCGLEEQTVLAWVSDEQVFLWSPDGQSEPHPFPVLEPSQSIAFGPDCTCIAAGHVLDGGIEFLDLERVHTSSTPGDERAADSRSARLGCPAQPLEKPDGDGVLSLAFNPKGTLVAAGREGTGTIDLWTLEDRSYRALRGPGVRVESIAFSPNGTLGSASSVGAVTLWDPKVTPPSAERLTGHSSPLLGIAFGGGRLATGHRDGTVVVWKLGRRQRLARELPWVPDSGHTDEVLSVTISPVDRKLASSSKDQTVRLWNLDSGEGEILKGVGKHTPRTVAFSVDGKSLASGSKEGKIQLWQFGDELNLKTWSTQGDQPVRDLVFDPDGTLATAIEGSEGGKVVLWDVGVEPLPSAENLEPPFKVFSLLFRDRGKTLVAGTRTGEVFLWNKATDWQPLFPDLAKDPVTLAQSADEKLLATAIRSRSDNLYLWRMPQREQLARLAGHESEVLSVAFDGRPYSPSELLFSADKHGILMVWDLASYREIGRLRGGHEEGKAINSLVVSSGPSKRTLVSAADDHRMVEWELDWKAVACDVAHRELTDIEWRTYVKGTRRRPDLCSDWTKEISR